MATFSRRRWSSDNSEDLGDSHDVHVLAVDDSLIDRKVIERLLKITSCKVTAVDSGRRALQYLGLDEEKTSVGFNGMKVDMTITDYCMPGMTGYELLKKIKGSSTFKEVPVVIMSSENILARIDRCLEEGAEDFIVKPVKLSDVKRLKEYMFGEDKVVTQDRRTNKRKLQDMSCSDHSLSSPPPPSMPSESPESLLMPSLASLSTESLSSVPSLLLSSFILIFNGLNSAHNALKRSLRTLTGSLDTIWSRVHSFLELQENEIKAIFVRSANKDLHITVLHLLTELTGKISHMA